MPCFVHRFKHIWRPPRVLPAREEPYIKISSTWQVGNRCYMHFSKHRVIGLIRPSLRFPEFKPALVQYELQIWHAWTCFGTANKFYCGYASLRQRDKYYDIWTWCSAFWRCWASIVMHLNSLVTSLSEHSYVPIHLVIRVVDYSWRMPWVQLKKLQKDANFSMFT